MSSLSFLDTIIIDDIMTLSLQGANASALEKEIGADQFPPNEHYFGLVNVSIFKAEYKKPSFLSPTASFFPKFSFNFANLYNL